jgi:hypothetical protein
VLGEKPACTVRRLGRQAGVLTSSPELQSLFPKGPCRFGMGLFLLRAKIARFFFASRSRGFF